VFEGRSFAEIFASGGVSDRKTKLVEAARIERRIRAGSATPRAHPSLSVAELYAKAFAER
jgi:hypothetical protein